MWVRENNQRTKEINIRTKSANIRDGKNENVLNDKLLLEIKRIELLKREV